MYYRAGEVQKFSAILSEALREEGFDDRIRKRHLFENDGQRVRAMNVLAGHQLSLAEAESDPAQQKAHRAKGHKLIEEANTISQIDPNNLISMCFYVITAGQLKQAQTYCETCEQQLKSQVSAVKYASQPAGQSASASHVKALCMLARAIIEFNKGHIKESLGFLKQMVNDNPRAPSDIWFAIGLCYYRLGNLPKAKLSMDKTIELDPENSMALVSIGIIEIASTVNDFEACDKAVQYFERSFQANPRNPLAIKYMAEHYFLKKDYDLCKQLSQAGILVLDSKRKPERSDLLSFRSEIEILRSHFYFLQGKVDHVLEKYEGAFQNYEESLRHNPKNYQTLFCLSKV